MKTNWVALSKTLLGRWIIKDSSLQVKEKPSTLKHSCLIQVVV